MTIDRLAERLSTAAAEVQGMRGELERFEPDAAAVSGRASHAVLDQIRAAWAGQRDLAASMSERIRQLADDVTLAAQTYRAVDELGRGHGQGD
jgi:hypothetical protein